MATFHLQIVTPDGLRFDGQAEKLVVRTTMGDVCLMANHVNYMAALGMGMATVAADGQTRRAACIGGVVDMRDNHTKLMAATFEWAEDIDLDRAKSSAKRAEAILANRGKLTEQELALAEAKLKRALVRQNVGSRF